MSWPTRSVSDCALEHRAHAFGDRELDLEPVREIAQHGRRRQPLDDHADLRGRLLRARAARDELARATVPARRRPARHDEVAHPGEAGERVRPGAGRLGEPPHLREAARDERRLRVVAEREPVRAARGQRDDVLRRRAQLDAGDVVAHVDAEEDGVHGDLNPHRELEVVARDDGGGRKPADDLVGDVRPGENGDGTIPDERREARAGRRVEALREAEDRRVAGQLPRRPRRRRGSEPRRRRARRRRSARRRSSRPRCRRAAPPSRSAGCGRSRLIASACSGSRAASVTSCPLSRRRHAAAVPHDPAPTTTALTRRSRSRWRRGRLRARTARAARSRPSSRSRA